MLTSITVLLPTWVWYTCQYWWEIHNICMQLRSHRVGNDPLCIDRFAYQYYITTRNDIITPVCWSNGRTRPGISLYNQMLQNDMIFFPVSKLQAVMKYSKVELIYYHTDICQPWPFILMSLFDIEVPLTTSRHPTSRCNLARFGFIMSGSTKLLHPGC